MVSSEFMFGIPIRKDLKRCLARAKTQLNQGAFDEAWAEGCAATVEQAGAWAIAGLDQLDP